MSLPQLKTASFRLDSLQGARPSADRPQAAIRTASAAPDRLSEAMESISELMVRCQEVEASNKRQTAAHDKAIDRANRTIAEKQKRIDQLETVIQEFKSGLQELLEDSVKTAEELQRSELQREMLSDMVERKSAKIAEMKTRHAQLEQEIARGRERETSAIDVVAGQIESLKAREHEILAETDRIRRAREGAERFLEAASLQHGAEGIAASPEQN